MDLRNLWSRLIKWLHNHRLGSNTGYDSPQLTDDGLLMDEPSADAGRTSAEQSAIKAVTVRGKTESLEKLQVGFDRLVDQLQNINDHLDKQVAQHNELITRVDLFPKLLENFPVVVEQQKVLTEQLMGQLKANLLKDQQMLEAVEKIPAEAAKQTDAIVKIDRQLAAAADVDIQMTQTFNKFNESLAKLNQSTQSHTEGIAQMSKTFAASDRYLKFIISRQTKQFMWVFYSALGICLAVIITLIGIIIYLSK